MLGKSNHNRSHSNHTRHKSNRNRPKSSHNRPESNRRSATTTPLMQLDTSDVLAFFGGDADGAWVIEQPHTMLCRGNMRMPHQFAIEPTSKNIDDYEHTPATHTKH
jgi:hypothetical protein